MAHLSNFAAICLIFPRINSLSIMLGFIRVEGAGKRKQFTSVYVTEDVLLSVCLCNSEMDARCYETKRFVGKYE